MTTAICSSANTNASDPMPEVSRTGLPTDHELPSSRSNRLPMVDGIRFICACWVMWIHIPESAQLAPTTSFGRFRLPTFVVFSVLFLFLSQKRHPQRTFKEYALGRLRILYLPFLAWAIIYQLSGWFLGLVTPYEWKPPGWTGFLINGGTPHLWFLPFILIVGVCMFPLARLLLAASVPARNIILTTFAAGLIASVFASHVANTLYESFVANMANINHQNGAKELVFRAVTLTPCVFLGIGIFFIYQSVRRRTARAFTVIGTAGAILLAICIAVNCLIRTNTVLESVAGVALAFIAFTPIRSIFLIWIAKWGRFSYGMYLVHVVFIILLRMLRSNVLHIAPSPWYDLFTLGTCIVLSLFAAILLSRSRYTRWLAPGSHPSTQDIGPRLEVRAVAHVSNAQLMGG
jgi:peptidoglycan/LPS O-acetylase OafA/YrhL